MTDYQDLRTEGRMSEEEFDARMAQARRRAGWELGDESWAGVIVGAFMSPRYDRENLEEEQR